MKRVFYIVMFMFLGYLVSMLLHAAIEIPILRYLSADPVRFSESLVWQNWWLFHSIGGKLLSLGFMVLGFFWGRYFWRILYIEKRYGTPRW